VQVLLLFAAVVLAVGVLDIFSRACEHVISAFGAVFAGWRPDGWPRGVQEENRERPWGSRRPAPTRPTLPRPSLTRVRAAVHIR
jgi:hypothetical protein